MFTALEDFDFQLLNTGEFKEDAVREEIIHPILKELGYSAGGLNRIVRSPSLSHPYVKIGSRERPITIIPDYLLLSANKPAWILDAKAPGEAVTSGGHVEQAFSYAAHPEIRSRYFALCNGREFALFEREGTDIRLYFQVSEIAQHWEALYALVGPRSFQPGAAQADRTNVLTHTHTHTHTNSMKMSSLFQKSKISNAGRSNDILGFTDILLAKFGMSYKSTSRIILAQEI